MKTIVALSFLSLCFFSCMENNQADLIIHNAVIYTVDEAFSIREAMAIKGDSILEVGAENQILNKYHAPTVLDLNKNFVYPGLIDAHSHFKGYAESLGKVNLLGVTDASDMCKKAVDFAKNENGDWITGRGWDNTSWENQDFPDKTCLDESFPDKYVVLKRIDGHAALVNQKVLDLAGIDENSRIDGGKVLLSNGKCTGILIDNAVDLVEKLIPEMDAETKKRLMLQAQKDCFEVGLTSVCDAGIDKADVDFIQVLQSSGELLIKLYVMLNPTRENFTYYLKKGPQQNRDLTIKSFKFYADGALGSRGASLIEPYSDVSDVGDRGLFLTSADTLRKYANELFNTGFQMNTHAIGDNANRTMLHLYGEVLGGVNDRRWRIEHAQVVNPADIHLFGEFSIIPSVQPTHCTSDMDWAEDRLGGERIAHAYAYRSLKDQNGMIAFGTDFPVENINPLFTLLSSMNRTDIDGNPEGGYRMEQSLDFESSLRGTTIWAALANFEENTKGSLENGKLADFVVFNRDLKYLDSKNLSEYRVEKTFVNGKEVFAITE